MVFSAQLAEGEGSCLNPFHSIYPFTRVIRRPSTLSSARLVRYTVATCSQIKRPSPLFSGTCNAWNENIYSKNMLCARSFYFSFMKNKKNERNILAQFADQLESIEWFIEGHAFSSLYDLLIALPPPPPSTRGNLSLFLNHLVWRRSSLGWRL